MCGNLISVLAKSFSSLAFGEEILFHRPWDPRKSHNISIQELFGPVLSFMSRIDLVSKNWLANCFRNFSKKDLKKTATEKYRRRNSKCRKNRKSKKNFSCYVKRLSNKYGKNSRNNKFFKILLLQRQKAKKGFVKSANFAKIAKVTRIFLPMWKDWATNMAKINFSDFCDGCF